MPRRLPKPEETAKCSREIDTHRWYSNFGAACDARGTAPGNRAVDRDSESLSMVCVVDFGCVYRPGNADGLGDRRSEPPGAELLPAHLWQCNGSGSRAVKIALITMVKHDGDIIEEFVRHTSRFVDELYIYDNASLDSSLDTLSKLQVEGFPITVLSCNSLSEANWDFNNLIRNVWAHTDAEYLAAFDADEFITAPSRSALEEELAELPPGVHAALPWVSYVPTLSDPKHETRTLARIRHCLVREHEQYQKLILARSFDQQKNVRTVMGVHDVSGATTIPLRSARLAHFPVRSLAQIQAKALLGWSRILSLGYDVGGYQWQRLYERLQRGPSWSDEEFMLLAQTYLSVGGSLEVPAIRYAPLPVVARRYITAEQELHEVSTAFCAQLARAIAHLSAENRRLKPADEIPS